MEVSRGVGNGDHGLAGRGRAKDGPRWGAGGRPPSVAKVLVGGTRRQRPITLGSGRSAELKETTTHNQELYVRPYQGRFRGRGPCPNPFGFFAMWSGRNLSEAQAAIHTAKSRSSCSPSRHGS